MSAALVQGSHHAAAAGPGVSGPKNPSTAKPSPITRRSTAQTRHRGARNGSKIAGGEFSARGRFTSGRRTGRKLLVAVKRRGGAKTRQQRSCEVWGQFSAGVRRCRKAERRMPRTLQDYSARTHGTVWEWFRDRFGRVSEVRGAHRRPFPHLEDVSRARIARQSPLQDHRRDISETILATISGMRQPCVCYAFAMRFAMRSHRAA